MYSAALRNGQLHCTNKRKLPLLWTRAQFIIRNSVHWHSVSPSHAHTTWSLLSLASQSACTILVVANRLCVITKSVLITTFPHSATTKKYFQTFFNLRYMNTRTYYKCVNGMIWKLQLLSLEKCECYRCCSPWSGFSTISKTSFIFWLKLSISTHTRTESRWPLFPLRTTRSCRFKLTIHLRQTMCRTCTQSREFRGGR